MTKTEQEAPRRAGPNPVLLPAIIAAICIVIELTLTASDYGLVATRRLRHLAYENGGFWPGLLQDWQANYKGQSWLMFLTYGFLHSGLAHLIVNMMTLVSLGRAVVERVGALRFAILYVTTLWGGAAGYALLNDGFQPMVGASGALFGLAGGLVAWNYVDRFTFRQGLWPVVRVVLFLVLLNVVLWWAMNGHLAWQTHLGGFVAGWIVALLLDPRGRPEEL